MQSSAQNVGLRYSLEMRSSNAAVIYLTFVLSAFSGEAPKSESLPGRSNQTKEVPADTKKEALQFLDPVTGLSFSLPQGELKGLTSALLSGKWEESPQDSYSGPLVFQSTLDPLQIRCLVIRERDGEETHPKVEALLKAGAKREATKTKCGLAVDIIRKADHEERGLRKDICVCTWRLDDGWSYLCVFEALKVLKARDNIEAAEKVWSRLSEQLIQTLAVDPKLRSVTFKSKKWDFEISVPDPEWSFVPIIKIDEEEKTESLDLTIVHGGVEQFLLHVGRNDGVSPKDVLSLLSDISKEMAKKTGQKFKAELKERKLSKRKAWSLDMTVEDEPKLTHICLEHAANRYFIGGFEDNESVRKIVDSFSLKTD